MKRFLITGGILMITVLVVVVVAFVVVQLKLFGSKQTQNTGGAVMPSTISATASSTRSSADTLTPAAGQTTSAPSVPTIPASGIPLRTIPLTDSQRSLLGKAGIDYDTFIITPDMVACGKEKLGAERFAEIVKGTAPTTLETMSLLRCL